MAYYSGAFQVVVGKLMCVWLGENRPDSFSPKKSQEWNVRLCYLPSILSLSSGSSSMIFFSCA